MKKKFGSIALLMLCLAVFLCACQPDAAIPSTTPPDTSSTQLATAFKGDDVSSDGIAELSLANDSLLLDWDGLQFELDDPITADNLTGLYYRDLDGDGAAEIAVTYLPDGYRAPLIVILERNGSSLIRHSYDVNALLLDINQNSSAFYAPELEVLQFSYSTLTFRQSFPMSNFEGQESLAEYIARCYVPGLTYFYLGNTTFNLRFEPILADGAMASLSYITDQPSEHCLNEYSIGEMYFGLTYDGNDFILSLPGYDPYYATETESHGTAARIAYYSVLSGSETFTMADTGQTLTIHQLNQAVSSDPSVTASVTKFTVLDMDRSYDGVPEVVLQLTVNGSDYGSLILRYTDGTVVGSTFGNRSLYDLKTDTTFSFSGGTEDYGYGMLTFSSSGYTLYKIAYCIPDADGALSYVVAMGVTTEEEFNTVIQEQSKKADATWYDFTASNIKSLF